MLNLSGYSEEDVELIKRHHVPPYCQNGISAILQNQLSAHDEINQNTPLCFEVVKKANVQHLRRS